MIARGFLLLVAAIVLFVDNDEAQILHRGEDTGAGANNNARLAALDATPLIGPFGIAKGGMQNGHLLAESLEKLAGDSGRQGDLGNQQQGVLAKRQSGFDAAQINFRLARTGHALRGEMF